MDEKQLLAPLESESSRQRDQEDRDFADAVERIYRHYGRDLSSFRRDVERELEERDSRQQR